jgi:hypothetical protein
MAKLNPKKLAAFVKKQSAPPFVKGKKPKIDVEEIRQQIADGDGDEEIMDLVDGYDPEKEGNPPSWVEDDDTWEAAKKAVGPEEESKAKDFWAVVSHVYSKMGGTVKGKSG